MHKKLVAFILAGAMVFNGVCMASQAFALENGTNIIKEESVKKSTRASEVQVSTIDELKNQISTQSEDLVIKLDSNFPVELSDSITINKTNSFNLTIDGSNLKLIPAVSYKGSLLSIDANTGGTIEIKNLKFDGKSQTTGKLLDIKFTNGNIVLENLDLANSYGGAVKLASDNKDINIKLNNIKIINNIAYDSAPALAINENSKFNVDISNSTIENNTGKGGGYETGAISSKSYYGNIAINNTVFKKNVNESLNTGVVGGGGGAIAFHYLRGNMNINESYFYENITSGEQGDVKNTYDGGAIYILDGRDGATVSIDKTTFDSNLAYDDGGAMMIQGTGNPGLTTNITNSTFYNNKAYGLSGGNLSGGAIQYFKNGGSSKVTNYLTGSTFIKNVSGSEKTKVIQKGGAIGLSGAGFLATASVTRGNTLFIGNQVYGSDGNINKASNYKDISDSTTVQLDSNLLNADKGENPQYTLEDVLGTNNAMLTNNYSTIKAGTYIEDIIVPTIPIKPEGLADNTSKAQLEGNDQRAFDKYKDIGAVEISWIKYDANTGIFGLEGESNPFIGEKYYEGSGSNSYYDIGYIDITNSQYSTIKSGDDLKIAKDGYEFVGWSKDKNAKEPDSDLTVGSDINYSADNETLYAVWKKDQVIVTYESNGGSAVPSVTVDKGESITEPTAPTKSGYKFAGWFTDEALRIPYTFGDPVNNSMSLYAKWTKTGGEGGGGVVDPPVNPPVPSNVVILACGEKYTDVLTATVLANEKNCSILLTQKDKVTEETLNEIKRLNVDAIVISGGPASVSEKVVDQLSDYKVIRLSGEDRYGTAREIGDEVRLTNGNKNQAMLVDGTNFPDVITISSLASGMRAPILLTEPASLNKTTDTALNDWKINDVTIGGSYNSVSQNVENSLSGKSVIRYGGADRYETAKLIGEKVRATSGNTKDMILVDGTDFPDGITVNSLAGRYGAPIMLTQPKVLNSVTASKIEDWTIKNVLIAGGTNSVSNEVENSLASLGVVNKERIAGIDRYLTAVKISERFTQENINIGGVK